MTPIRKLALGISSRVVRWASPGCKEWAEGLEREARVIENDWAALGWAIGSMRVLFDRRPVPLTSLDEVLAEAKKYLEVLRAGVWVLLMPLTQGPPFLWKFFHAKNSLERAGCALVMFSSMLAGAYTFLEWRRQKQIVKYEVYDDILAWARLYRAELARRGTTTGIQTFILLCWCVGFVLAQRDGVLVFGGCMGLLGLAFVPVILQALRNNQRRIEEIDALLTQRDGVHSL
jgi:hypothetical protein